MRNRLTLLGIAGFAALTLAGCAGHVAIKVDHTPPKEPTGAIASAPATAIKVVNFRDQRGDVEPIFLGRRFAAMNVPMGDVTSERPVFEIVSEAVRAELAAAGHRVVADKEAVVVSGVIKKFSVGTPVVTALYWDVVADVSLVVEIKSAATGARLMSGTYEAQATERTYLNPSDKLMKSTLERALGEVMTMLRSDGAVARALSPQS